MPGVIFRIFGDLNEINFSVTECIPHRSASEKKRETEPLHNNMQGSPSHI